VAGNGKLIQIIDDDELNAWKYQVLLGSKGYSTIAAHTLAEAVKQHLEYEPDAMLIRADMRKVNSLALVRCLRQQPRYVHTPIVMYTETHSPAQREAFLQLGATAYCTHASIHAVFLLLEGLDGR